MTQHAGLFFGEREKGFGRRSVGVVALTTLLEHVGLVLVDTLKSLFLVAEGLISLLYTTQNSHRKQCRQVVMTSTQP